MEAVLAHFRPDFSRHNHRHDAHRSRHWCRRFFHDLVVCAVCNSLAVSCLCSIFHPDSVSRAFESVVTAQSEDFWAVFCGRKRLKPNQWKLLHKVGIYSLWIYAFSVYWWELFYYPDPDGIDYVYYSSGFLAWGLRSAAWRKKRLQRAARIDPQGSTRPGFMLIGMAMIGIGLIVACSGLAWQAPAEELLTGHAVTR